MVEKYIKYLLFEYDCVVIPGFGGFIANYVGAEIHPVHHTFLPPSKNIAFNEMLKLNDGLLISQIASGENISRLEAGRIVTEFTEMVKSEISRNEKYVFAEIGTLYLNYEHKLQFEPDNRINYLSSSFGLPKFVCKPIERVATHHKYRTKDRRAADVNQEATGEEDQLLFPATPKRSRTRLLLAIIVPSLLLLAGTTGYLLFVGDGKNALSSFDPFVSLKITTTQDTVSTSAVDDSFLYADTIYSQTQDTDTTAGFETWTANATDSTITTNTEAAPESATSTEEQPATTAANSPVESTITATAPNAPVEKAVAIPVVEKAPETAEANANGVASPSTPPRYYVIVGGFSVKKNAFKLRRRLVRKGNEDAKVIVPKTEGNLLKVAYANFGTFNEAASKAEELKAEYGNSVWVLKY